MGAAASASKKNRNRGNPEIFGVRIPGKEIFPPRLAIKNFFGKRALSGIYSSKTGKGFKRQIVMLAWRIDKPFIFEHGQCRAIFGGFPGHNNSSKIPPAGPQQRIGKFFGYFCCPFANFWFLLPVTENDPGPPSGPIPAISPFWAQRHNSRPPGRFFGETSKPRHKL
ncbi:MAG: hypothetical protein CM15mP100_5890 [Alphaproteobacteria bacterium]|nr:MAG: hypothetical protein CM15mP100_5890 [Alphaproteobacteria bacterium]